MADNIIVGSGPGIESQVKVFSSKLPGEKGKAPDVFSSFTPYPGLDSPASPSPPAWSTLGSGRETIVTAPGPGDAPQVKTFRCDLYTPTARAQANGTATRNTPTKPNEPTMTSTVPGLRRELQRRRLAVDRLGRRRRRRREEHRHRPARRRRHRAGVVDGSRLDGNPGDVSGQPEPSRRRRQIRQIASFAPFPGANRPASRSRPPARPTAPTCWSAARRRSAQEVRKYALEPAGTRREDRWRPSRLRRCR